MILRQFNDRGVAKFQEFLKAARANAGEPVPHDILQDDNLTEIVKPEIELQQRTLSTKLEAATYLRDALAPIGNNDAIGTNAGLWTWLALFFFDSVCPQQNGGRKVRIDAWYIFSPSDGRAVYLHQLYVSWKVLNISRGFHRLLLNFSLATRNRVTEEPMKRLFLLRIPCIFEVLDRLYWDDRRNKPRSGIVSGTNANRGDLTHRLPARVQQLECTYDLQSVDAAKMLDLLGREFDFSNEL